MVKYRNDATSAERIPLCKAFVQYLCLGTLSLLVALYVLLIAAMNAREAGALPNDAPAGWLLWIAGFFQFPEDIASALHYINGFCCAVAAVALLLCVTAGTWILRARYRRPLFCSKYVSFLPLFVVLLVVVLNLNGTHLHQWRTRLSPGEASAPLWGVSRPIRFDEWSVWTPLAIQQSFNGYPSVSPLIGGGGFDVTWISVGGLPAWSLALVFKPLYWGFMLLGPSRGISLLWISRLVLLLWVSYRFALVYTNGNRTYSVAAGLMIGLAPYVQWWFSQSVAEVFILAQFMLLSACRYTDTASPRRRWLYGGLIGWSAGCLVMVGYLSWVIPAFYLTLALTAYFLMRNRAALTRRDIPRLLAPCLISLALVLLIVKNTWPTLMNVRNSEYPGTRLYTGGTMRPSFFTGAFCLLLPFCNLPKYNMCELSAFMGFAPLGLFLNVYACVKRRRADGFAATLIALEAFFLAFCLFGFPKALAEATLLSQCTRLEAVIGFMDVVLLIHGLSQSPKAPIIPGIALSLCFGGLSALLTQRHLNLAGPALAFVIAVNVLAFTLLLLCVGRTRRDERFIALCLAMIMLLAGGFVNPIEVGIDVATESNYVRALRAIDSPPESLFVVEGSSSHANATLMAGKRTFNSTRIYPDPEGWSRLDPEGAYREVWNRFCHVTLSLTKADTSFELLTADNIKLALSFKDLKTIGADYLVSKKNLAGKKRAGIRFIEVGNSGKLHIYRLDYPSRAD